MPGLCGFVAGEKYISDVKEKLLNFNKVQDIPGIKFVKQSWHGSRCTVLNCQTGLLLHTSERHAQDIQKRVHLFCEGEVYNREYLLDLAAVLHPKFADHSIRGWETCAKFPCYTSAVRRV